MHDGGAVHGTRAGHCLPDGPKAAREAYMQLHGYSDGIWTDGIWVPGIPRYTSLYILVSQDQAARLEYSKKVSGFQCYFCPGSGRFRNILVGFCRVSRKVMRF